MRSAWERAGPALLELHVCKADGRLRWLGKAASRPSMVIGVLCQEHRIWGIIDFVGYSLYALAAKEAAIRVAQASSGITPVELAQGLWLLPISKAMRPDRRATDTRPFGDVFWCLTAQVESLARRASMAGLVAYLEAEIFGGDGTQAAVAWRDGNVRLGPVSSELWMQDRQDSAQWPFNRVLRELGVSRGDAFDEFDAAGLYRHRSTEDWAQTPES